MRYEELYDDFIKLFPADIPYFLKREEETGVDRGDGMHIMFGMVVCPFILQIISEDEGKAKKAFDFIEQMETCGIDEIANVAEVTVLEHLMTDEKGGMDRIEKYLGKESRETVNHMAKYFKTK